MARAYVTIQGRPHKLERKTTPKGVEYLKFGLGFTQGAGDTRKTNWINITAWDKYALSDIKEDSEGTFIVEFSTREYTAKDGTTKTALEGNLRQFMLAYKERPAASQSNEDEPAWLRETE